MTEAFGDRDGVLLTWAAAPPTREARRAVAWRALRELLAEVGAAGEGGGAGDASLENPCPVCGGPHGPVQVSGVPWLASVSYANGFAVAAIAPAAREAFGIDAVALQDPQRDAAGWDGVGAPGPVAWARVEAAHKADGRGLRLDPRTTVVTGLPDGTWLARLAGRGDALVGWESARTPPGVVVSVAVARASVARATTAAAARATTTAAEAAGAAPRHPATR